MTYRLSSALMALTAFAAVFFLGPMSQHGLSPIAAAQEQEQKPEGGDEAIAAEEESAVGDEAEAVDIGDEGADLLTEDAAALSDGEAGAFADPSTAEKNWGRLQPLANLVEAGGPIIIILAILSIVSLAVIIVKLVQFTALRVGDHKFIEKASQMLQRGHKAKALDFVARRRGVIARVMETALRGRMVSQDDGHVRDEVERVARLKLDGLERGLPLLSLIATISPLLGLLGTVLGMIDAFQQLENAGDRVDPAILSGGIWEALLTTAAGLSVAIPAAAFFSWLQRAVDVAGQHMEDAATRVFTADLYRDSKPAKTADADD